MVATSEFAALEVRNLTVVFKGAGLSRKQRTAALVDVSFTLRPGRTLGLVGESGSGKSTLGNVLAGLVEPTSGGLSKASSRELARRGSRQLVGQSPQWALNPRLRIWRSVAEPLTVSRATTRQKRRQAAIDMLQAVGLERGIAFRYPHQLSGGQLQRAAVARALVAHPSLVIFDEAVSALDVSIQVQTINVIRDMQARLGFASLFISHDLPSVRYAAHDVAVLYRGQMMHSAPVSAFYERPVHPYSLALQSAEDPSSPFGLREELPGGDTGPTGGCPLASRCPFVIELCRSKRPALTPVNGQESACHRASEMATREDLTTLLTAPDPESTRSAEPASGTTSSALEDAPPIESRAVGRGSRPEGTS